jgi:hypothetical protein
VKGKTRKIKKKEERRREEEKRGSEKAEIIRKVKS